MENCVYYHYKNSTIAPILLDHIKDYVERGVLPGWFLQAVITNNFRQAVFRVPKEEANNLEAYAHYFYAIVPAECHGSEEAMKAWVARGGKEGKG